MSRESTLNRIADDALTHLSTRLPAMIAVALAVLGPVTLTGCSSRGPELGEVTGKVTLDGEPLPEALVTFKPQRGRPSLAETDAQGNYSLSYRVDAQGARLGEHRVMITTFKQADGLLVKKDVPERVPPEYNRRSTLTATIEPGANTINFELESK